MFASQRLVAAGESVVPVEVGEICLISRRLLRNRSVRDAAIDE